MKYGFYMVLALRGGRKIEVRRSFTHKGAMWTGTMLRLANGIYFRRIEQKGNGLDEYPAATLHVTGNSSAEHRIFHRKAGSNAAGGSLAENMKLWVEEKTMKSTERRKEAKPRGKKPARDEPNRPMTVEELIASFRATAGRR